MPDQTDTKAVFYTVDRDLVILAVSEDALRVWGKSRVEILGRGLLHVFPFLAETRIHHAHLDALRTFRPVRLETESHYLPGLVDVEIYPIAGGLQVRYWQHANGPKTV